MMYTFVYKGGCFMRSEGHRGGGRRGIGHRTRELENVPSQGAKTFRRKRAIHFLEQLETRQASLKKQLETPELQAINTILLGELKATESIIDDFVQTFELYEFEEYTNFRNSADTKEDVSQDVVEETE